MSSLFGFKKKPVSLDLKAIASGKMVSITQVPDEVFAQKMMGDGFAIEPTQGTITAPADGEIKTLADTKHAVMMTTSDGLELLLHLGLDTVELDGKPFDALIKIGDKVKAGTPLVTMDLEAIRAAGKKATVITVVTNMDKVANIEVNSTENVTAMDTVAKITLS